MPVPQASLDVPADERAANRKQISFEEKESCRWLEMMQNGEQIARSMPQTRFVMLADSEADMAELMLTVVAWRVEYLKGACRADGGSPCTEYFSESEWMAVMIFLTRRPVDVSKPPTMEEFMKAIAQLGGYINKKSQGPPGSQTIWRGMSRFSTIVEAYLAFS